MDRGYRGWMDAVGMEEWMPGFTGSRWMNGQVLAGGTKGGMGGMDGGMLQGRQVLHHMVPGEAGHGLTRANNPHSDDKSGDEANQLWAPWGRETGATRIQGPQSSCRPLPQPGEA